jgi:CubicO group peptidase (beta-lactamase class C family)
VAACAPDTERDVARPAPPSSTRPTTAPTTASAPSTTEVGRTTEPPVTPWGSADFTSLDTFLEQTNGDAFAIWEAGSTIHEWYRTDASSTRDIASAQKSILSILVGRAIGDALVQMDTPIDDVLGRGWTPNGESAGITVDHLLAMTSGLDDQRQVVAAPGERWVYSGAFAALFDVLTTVAGRSLNELAQRWLFAPAGATSSQFYDRPAGIFAPIGLRSTVPDLVAIGRLVLDGGPPGLGSGWLDRSFTPSQALNRSYGLLWWLNGQDTFMLPGLDRRLPGPLVPAAPSSMVAALGKDDQKLYIVPEHRLVVARLGGRAVPAGQAARSPFDAELWERLSALRG